VGEFTEKIALLRANDDEGLEDEYSVRREGERGDRREREREGFTGICLSICVLGGGA
jgi:hypothetical protein